MHTELSESHSLVRQQNQNHPLPSAQQLDAPQANNLTKMSP